MQINKVQPREAKEENANQRLARQIEAMQRKRPDKAHGMQLYTQETFSNARVKRQKSGCDSTPSGWQKALMAKKSAGWDTLSWQEKHVYNVRAKVNQSTKRQEIDEEIQRLRAELELAAKRRDAEAPLGD